MTDPDAQLEQIRQREQAATKGPWFVADRPPNGVTVYWDVDAPICPMRWIDGLNQQTVKNVQNDAEFIAHAREDIPYLLAELTRLRAERNEWKAHVEEARETFSSFAEHHAATELALGAAEAALTEAQHRALAAEQVRDVLLTEQNQQRETIKDAVQTARNYYAMWHDETWKKRMTKWEAAIVKSEEGEP